MLLCPKCKKEYSEDYTFCEGCGSKLIKSEKYVPTQPKNLVFDRIERSVFFRVTRSYTWAILIIAILGFIGAIIYLASDIRPFIVKDTGVSAAEVKKVLDGKRAIKSPPEGEISTRTIDPELLAKLDKEIYELIVLLPKADQEKVGIEKLRSFIRDRIGRYTTMNEKMSIIREAKNILPKFGEPERGEALATFFNIKAEKENAIAMGRTDALIKLGTIGGTFFALIMTIALFSLILVLLAIERNTRKK
jgi:hypothetical protein